MADRFCGHCVNVAVGIELHIILSLKSLTQQLMPGQILIQNRRAVCD